MDVLTIILASSKFLFMSQSRRRFHELTLSIDSSFKTLNATLVTEKEVMLYLCYFNVFCFTACKPWQMQLICLGMVESSRPL